LSWPNKPRKNPDESISLRKKKRTEEEANKKKRIEDKRDFPVRRNVARQLQKTF